MNQETRQCQNCKQNFVIEPDDFGFYQQIQVPPPTWCPECRMERRLIWLGNNLLYKRKCDFTGEQVISFYHPDIPLKVYKQNIWWSDQWDPKSYGRDYDFNKSFFEQFKELKLQVPHPALHTEYSSMVQSDYCNAASELKNCYLCFFADRAENCGYSYSLSYQKDCFDLSWVNYCELCYDSINLEHCYATMYSKDCRSCQSVYFSEDLVGCSDCFGCAGLRNKKYCIFNQPYSKEDYKLEISKYDLGSFTMVQELKQKAKKVALLVPKKNFHGTKTYGSSGDYLYNCKNVLDSYWVDTAEDVRYSQLLQAINTTKAYDYTSFSYNAEWIYECSWVGINTRMVKFSSWNYSGHDSEYCYGCHGSGNCFGCVGLRNGEYCILNKQYSKERYQEMVARIKKQMAEIPYVDSLGRKYFYGEFLPSELCPWAYNETRALPYLPYTKDQAIERGFSWREPDSREYQGATYELPDNIKDIPDTILNEILKCDCCGRNYRLIPMELEFYRRMSIPIPRQCYVCRELARNDSLNKIKIYQRVCAKCGQNIQTSYPPKTPEIVYCETCYNTEVA